MNKKLEYDLNKTMEICIDIMQGRDFHCTMAEMKCIPRHLHVKTKTEAKKKGLELKRGAKRIGTMEWQIPTGGKAYGDLYLGSSFKYVNGYAVMGKPGVKFKETQKNLIRELSKPQSKDSQNIIAQEAQEAE